MLVDALSRVLCWMRHEEGREMAINQLQDLLVINLPENSCGRLQSGLEGLQQFGPQLGGVFQRQRHGKTLQVHIRLDNFVVENISESCCIGSRCLRIRIPHLDASNSAARDITRTHSFTLTHSLAHSLTPSLTHSYSLIHSLR